MQTQQNLVQRLTTWMDFTNTKQYSRSYPETTCRCPSTLGVSDCPQNQTPRATQGPGTTAGPDVVPECVSQALVVSQALRDFTSGGETIKGLPVNENFHMDVNPLFLLHVKRTTAAPVKNMVTPLLGVIGTITLELSLSAFSCKCSIASFSS